MRWDPDSDVLALLALVVSVASLGVAWYFARKQQRQGDRLLKLERARERDRIAERDSAALRAEIVREPGSRDLLVITNHGNSGARAVRVELDGKPATEHLLALGGQEMASEIGPGSSVWIFLAVVMGSPGLVRARVTWEDDSGEPGEWSSQIPVY